MYDKSGLIRWRVVCTKPGSSCVHRFDRRKTLPSKGIPVTVDGDRLPGVPRRPGEDAAPRARGVVTDMRNPEHVTALAKLEGRALRTRRGQLARSAETVESGAEIDECVEQIDIGGPSMVRASAKNHASVAVVVSPLRQTGARGCLRRRDSACKERKKLAALAFRHTAEYDVAVASWMDSTLAPGSRQRRPWPGRTVATERGG